MLWNNEKDAKMIANDFHYEHTPHLNSSLDF